MPRHGNCFFDAALHSGKITGTSQELRHALCDHLAKYAEEYVGFLLNKFSPVDEESFVTNYLQEVESLKQEGYWSSKVADFFLLHSQIILVSQ
ncbi:hypothetical protein DPMN_132532 [Dreissena polymorpha]|uniref:OTU domain-containing protein n=1 Tax=Dreissena polymorpha TaxID=45954 RepID=A0A9D4FSP2_DREPO|nr:hypothetical protein DPMN_132532 [Dreissena polymorpha]